MAGFLPYLIFAKKVYRGFIAGPTLFIKFEIGLFCKILSLGSKNFQQIMGKKVSIDKEIKELEEKNEEAVSKDPYAKQYGWIEGYINLPLFIVIIGLTFGVIGFFYYKDNRMKRIEKDAQFGLWHAQQRCEKNEFNLAVNGDEIEPGILKIIEEYPHTHAAQWGHFYMASVHIKRKAYKEAIASLEKISLDDPLINAFIFRLKGDIYVKTRDYDKAIEVYKEGQKIAKNSFITPVIIQREAVVWEEREDEPDLEKAHQCYKKIVDEWKDSPTYEEGAKNLGRIAYLLTKE